MLLFPVWGGVDSETNEDAALRLSYLKDCCCFPEMPLWAQKVALPCSGDCVPTEQGGLLEPPFLLSLLSRRKVVNGETCGEVLLQAGLLERPHLWGAWVLGLLSGSQLSRLAGGRSADADYPGYNSQEDLLLKIWDAWVAQLANKHLPSAPLVIPGRGIEPGIRLLGQLGACCLCLLLPLLLCPLSLSDK